MMRSSHVRTVLILFSLALVTPITVHGEGNIDPVEKYSWGENVGWQNWNPGFGEVTVVTNGVSGYLTGHIWCENIGWIKLGDGIGPYANSGPTDWGVNLDAAGNLSGYAWGENVGWINFDHALCTAAIEPADGRFSGYAWGENIGWVNLRGTSPDYGVQTTAYGTAGGPMGTLFKFR